MLETIREFAIEKLDEDLELHTAARRAHAACYADFTEHQWERLTGHDREAAFVDLISDIENLRQPRGAIGSRKESSSDSASSSTACGCF